MSCVGAAWALWLAGCGVSDAMVEATVGSSPDEPPPPAVHRLSLGLTPFLGREETLERTRPLVEYLARAVGVPVEARPAASYDELVDLASSGEVDLVALSPLAYVLAVDRGAPLRILATPVERGSPTYLGYVVVRADDRRHRRVSDLRGARFAFVARTSASGWLYPRALLREYGLDPDRDLSARLETGTHPGVVQAVLEGRADAGAIGSSLMDIAGASGTLRVIGKTARIPFDAFCVRTGLDEGTTRRVRRALLAVSERADLQRQVAEPLAFSGWIEGDDARYDSVRRALRLERRAGQHPVADRTAAHR